MVVIVGCQRQDLSQHKLTIRSVSVSISISLVCKLLEGKDGILLIIVYPAFSTMPDTELLLNSYLFADTQMNGLMSMNTEGWTFFIRGTKECEALLLSAYSI